MSIGKLSVVMPPGGGSGATYLLPRESWTAFFSMGVILPLHIIVGLGCILTFCYMLWGLGWGTIDRSSYCALSFVSFLVIYAPLYLYPAEKKFPGWKGQDWLWNLVDYAASGKNYCGRFEIRSYVEDAKALYSYSGLRSFDSRIAFKLEREQLKKDLGIKDDSDDDESDDENKPLTSGPLSGTVVGGSAETNEALEAAKAAEKELKRLRKMFARHGITGISDEKVRELAAEADMFEEENYFEDETVDPEVDTQLEGLDFMRKTINDAADKHKRNLLKYADDDDLDAMRRAKKGLDNNTSDDWAMTAETEEDVLADPDLDPSLRTLFESPIDPEAQYIVGCHPHGVIVQARSLWRSGLMDRFLKRDWRMISASVLFYIPIIREISLWFGAIDCSKSVCDQALKKGVNLALYPGGLDEANISAEVSAEEDPAEAAAKGKSAAIRLKLRKGFIRLALKHNIPILPAFCFGEIDCVHATSILPNWLKCFCQNNLRFSTTWFLGKPITPNRSSESSSCSSAAKTEFTTKSGEVIRETGMNPKSPEFDLEVERLFKEYRQGIQDVFDFYKYDIPGYAHREIEFI